MKATLPSETIFGWLRANLGNDCLGVMTAFDRSALSAAVQIMDSYTLSRHPSLISAFGAVVRRMQPSAWALAYHAIAHVGNWSDRPRIWAEAGLPQVAFGRCRFEPAPTGATVPPKAAGNHSEGNQS